MSSASTSPSTSHTASPQPELRATLRVIFLDVDGVVCCNQNGHLEPDKMKQLLRITNETSAKVCLSTNWRLYAELREHLYAKLGAAGIECIGTTPDAGDATHGEAMRPCEIGAWIKFWHQDAQRQRITSFVAVDDRSLLEEKGGSFLRGAPPASAPCAGIRSIGTCSPLNMLTPRRALGRPLCADQPGARLDGAICHAHH